jgi:hypothetical protein
MSQSDNSLRSAEIHVAVQQFMRRQAQFIPDGTLSQE